VSKTVLFVSHSGSRTGSPIVLLEIVRWIRSNTDIRCSVLFWAGGSLVPEFEELAPCRVLHSAQTNNAALLRQVWDHLSMRPDDTDRVRGRFERTVRAGAKRVAAALDENWMREWRSYDLVYANSVGSARAVRALAPNSPLLAHVHESEYSLHHTESRQDVSLIVDGRHPIIAASGAVKSTLVDEFGVSGSRIHVIHEFIRLPPPVVDNQAVQSLRASLDIPDDAFVVGGAGTIEWRKGADIFVQLGRKLAVMRPDAEIHCVWVGGARASEPLERVHMDIDVKKSGTADRIHFVGEHPNPWAFYHLFDVFALTSRADPFPLVALEAASIGRPILCFAGGGGMPEFVADGGGFALPYLGVDEMAGRVLELHDDAELRSALGQSAGAQVRDSYDAAVVVPRIAELIVATAR
jgi:glycosyltransferase involved in cell wall biosynthesis